MNTLSKSKGVKESWEEGFETGYEKGFELGFINGKEDTRFANVRRSKGMKRNWEVLKRVSRLEAKLDRFTSYTCCNLEVNEKAGSEVHCAGCGEYCETMKEIAE